MFLVLFDNNAIFAYLTLKLIFWVYKNNITNILPRFNRSRLWSSSPGQLIAAK